MFTEWLFEKEGIQDLAAEKAANLKADKGFSDLQVCVRSDPAPA